MQTYLALLKQLIAFKSISTDNTFQDDVLGCADWLVNLFKENDFQVKQITGYSNPIIFASLQVNPEFQTVLIYGHYDVQPPQMEDGWFAEPFTVAQKAGRLLARGIADNKGQFLIHLVTVLELQKQGKLKYNIKFILEGDEESGSELLPSCIKDNAELLKSDFVLFSDGELTAGHPTIDVGFRGMFNCSLTLRTSAKDNHSGIYGGSIPNSALELGKILAAMYDNNGILTLPGISNDPAAIKTSIVENNRKLPFNSSEFLNITGASRRQLEGESDFYTQTGFMTSAEITSLRSGYIGGGYRNAIPGTAEAKINFRISPAYAASQVAAAFEKFIQVKRQPYFELTLNIEQMSDPIKLDSGNEFVRAAQTAASQVYGKECLLRYCGAIVPVAGIFADVLEVPVVSIGLANEDCNMHGADENFDLELIGKGLDFSREMLGV